MSTTRQEREKLVLDLYYNQGKNIREIAQEARMSFRNIGINLNKADEGREQKQNNNNEIENKNNNNKNKNSSSNYPTADSLQAYFLKVIYSNTSSRRIKPKRVRNNQILQRLLQAKPNERPQYGI